MAEPEAEQSGEAGPDDDQGLDQNQRLAALIGGVILLIILISQCGGGDNEASEPVVPSTSTTVDEGAAETASGGERGEGFAPLNCGSLLAGDAAAIALETDDPDGRIISTFLFAQGERCHYEDADNGANYVIVEPATAADFAPGATRLGATAQSVGGLGAVAVWFGGADAGSLTVAEESEHGTVLLRIEFGQPDVSDERRLHFATDLAQQALLRIPGIDWTPEPEPEPVRLEYAPEVTSPIDPDRIDLDANIDWLVAKAGVSEADAVAATLRYLLGDDPGIDLLPPSGVIDERGPGLLARTRALIAADEDPDGVLAALVERIAPTNLPDPPFGGSEADTASGASRTLRPLGPRLQTDEIDGEEEPLAECSEGMWFNVTCAFFYGPTDAGAALTPDNYYVGAPAADELPMGDFTIEFVELLRGALTDAALRFEPLGQMPPVLIWAAPFDFKEEVWPVDDPNWCVINVYLPPALGAEPEVVRQWIAFEMASCFLKEQMPARVGKPHEPDEWMLPAANYYLSAWVEPDGRIEEPHLAQFDELEFDEPVERRRRANTFLFLFLHERIGAQGVLDLIRTAPSDGGYEGQAASLANSEGFDQLFHDFTRAVGDIDLPDGAGNPYQHEVIAFRADLAPNLLILEDVHTLATQRWRFFVPDGMTACISFEKTGDVFTGWRPFDSNRWEPVPPTELDGVSLLVATTTGPPGTLTIEVDDLVETGESCDDDEEPFIPNPLELEDCPLECEPSRFFGDVEIPVLFDENPGLRLLDE